MRTTSNAMANMSSVTEKYIDSTMHFLQFE